MEMSLGYLGNGDKIRELINYFDSNKIKYGCISGRVNKDDQVISTMWDGITVVIEDEEFKRFKIGDIFPDLFK